MPTINIKDLPEFKTARLIDLTEDRIPKITELGTMIFYCSDCSRFSDIHWAYCPRCGAKMDGEENS